MESVCKRVIELDSRSLLVVIYIYQEYHMCISSQTLLDRYVSLEVIYYQLKLHLIFMMYISLEVNFKNAIYSLQIQGFSKDTT